jgi:hypothetical protein
MKKAPVIAFILFLVVAAISEFSDFREKSSRQDHAVPLSSDTSFQELLTSEPVKKARQDTRVLRPIDIQDPAYGSLQEKHLVLIPVRFDSFNAVTSVPDTRTGNAIRGNEIFSLQGSVRTTGKDIRFSEALVIDNPFDRPFLIIFRNDPEMTLVIEPLSFEIVTAVIPKEDETLDIAVFEWTDHAPSQVHKNLLFEYYTLDLGRPKIPHTFIYSIGGTNTYSLAPAVRSRD